MCDTLPLDNFKIYSHLAMPYITWGLIWDSKIKKKESLVLRRFFCLKSQLKILKAARFEAETGKDFKFTKEGTTLPLIFKNHQISNSSIRDQLKFEISLSDWGWIDKKECNI